MAQDISIWGMDIEDVPAVNLPKNGGGQARFLDETDIITYYTGSTTPSASLGDNGDIYLKVT